MLHLFCLSMDWRFALLLDRRSLTGFLCLALLLPACAGPEAAGRAADSPAADTLEMESLRISGLRPGDSLAHARRLLPPPDSLRKLYLEMQDAYALHWHAGRSGLEFQDSVLRSFWVQDGALALEAGGMRLQPGDPEAELRRRFPRSYAQAYQAPPAGMRMLRVCIRGYDAELLIRLEHSRVYSITLWETQ